MGKCLLKVNIVQWNFRGNAEWLRADEIYI